MQESFLQAIAADGAIFGYSYWHSWQKDSFAFVIALVAGALVFAWQLYCHVLRMEFPPVELCEAVEVLSTPQKQRHLEALVRTFLCTCPRRGSCLPNSSPLGVAAGICREGPSP